jgi:integrase
MNKTVPIRTKPEIQGFLKRLREWNANYYIAAVIGIQWGLRCSDILNLRIKNVIAGGGSRIQIKDRITVQEIKTGHERHILITEKMKDVLHEHIRGFPSPVDMNAPLVLSRNKLNGDTKALSRHRLWRVISDTARKLEINGPIGTHSLRKTFAYQAWSDGERIDVIQKEFGHASVDTTHRYACIPDERQDSLYEKMNFALPGKRRRRKNRNGKPGLG